MKNKKILATIAIMTALVIGTQVGCAGKTSQSNDTPGTGNAQIANPWRDVTEAEARKMFPHSFSVPAGAENVSWSVMESGSETLLQLSFDLNGDTFTAREQATNDKGADIAGMYYNWTYQSDITLANWADGKMKGTYYRFVGDEEWADLCKWYDETNGISYSVSVTSKDLDGFDLQAIAEMLAPAVK